MSRQQIKGYCIVSAFSICLYLILTKFDGVLHIGSFVINLLMPFIIGIVMAFILNGPVNFFEKLVKKHLVPKAPYLNERKIRGLAISLTYIVSIILIIVLFSFIAPQLLESIGNLGRNVQTYLNSLSKIVDDISEFVSLPEEILKEIENFLQSTVKSIFGFLTGSVPKIFNAAVQVGGGLFKFIIGTIVSIHLLSDKERLISQAKRINRAFLPAYASGSLEQVFQIINKAFKNYVTGQLLDALFVGVASSIGLSVLNFPYALLIGTIMGIANVVPFFGPFISAVPGFLIILVAEGYQKALWYAFFTLILQQIDGNIVGPKIIGETVGLPSLWVLFSVIVGGALFGVPGMILGTPVFVVFYELLKLATKRREGYKDSW